MATFSEIYSMETADVAEYFGRTRQGANSLRQTAKLMINSGKGGQEYRPRESAGSNPVAGDKPAKSKEPRTSEIRNPLLQAAVNAALYGLGITTSRSDVRGALEDEGKRMVIANVIGAMPGLDKVLALNDLDAWAGVRSAEQRRKEECDDLARRILLRRHEAKAQEAKYLALLPAGWICIPPAGYQEAVRINEADIKEMAQSADYSGLISVFELLVNPPADPDWREEFFAEQLNGIPDK